MFEKEAKEYLQSFEGDDCVIIIDREERKQAFLAGAEFGYNKCFEQIQKIVDEHTRLDCIITELLRLKESE